MSRTMNAAAGLILALPAAAVVAQDNPWRVPNAPGGSLPGYVVDGRATGTPWGFGSSADDYGEGWRLTPSLKGSPGAAGQGPRVDAARGVPARREAGLPPHAGASPTGPALTGPTGHPWHATGPSVYGAGYLPPSMDAAGPRATAASGSDVAAPVYPDDPTLRQQSNGPYGEYPPLDTGVSATTGTAAPHAAGAQRPSYASHETRAMPRPAAPQQQAGAWGSTVHAPDPFGPSTLTVPMTGLPGLTGHGYGPGGLPGPSGHSAYGSLPYPYPGPIAPAAPGW
ncbi:MAG: hypothetical protein NW217_11145 [Hyphomicrobiaceae bacterium]|nr:hypothetical protein [Hyphomicrobiaceae bacterium]